MASHPTSHPNIDEVSHGRGGAGNIEHDETPYGDGEIVREGAAADGAHLAGRGGAGNLDPSGLKATNAKPGDADMVPEAAVLRPSSDNYHVGVRDPLKPRCPDCFPIRDPPHYPTLLLSNPPPPSSSTTCTCAHQHHDPTSSSSSQTMSAAAHLQLDLQARKHKKQESMAVREITKLIQPVSAQRGGQGNVHKEEPPVTVHEGLADKLKYRLLGRKKNPKP